MIKWINKYKNRITALSGVLIAVGFILNTLGYAAAADYALILATLIAVVPIMYKAYLALRMKAFSIELLVTIAVIGALFIREYTESSVVTFLFLFGDFLEARTLEKTRSSLRSLIDMAPQEAIILHGADQIVVPVEEVAVGDRLFIKPGGKIPVDGIIVKGQAAINEAAVTGEAIPANKSLDDKVFSGTLVDDGFIEMIAEKVGDDTTFAKIIELVEEAQESKSKAERFLDAFANFNPIIPEPRDISCFENKRVIMKTQMKISCALKRRSTFHGHQREPQSVRRGMVRKSQHASRSKMMR